MSALVLALGFAVLIVLVIAFVAYERYHARQPVPWATNVMSGEMRSKLYSSANYRCCSDGRWVCTNRGCGGASWADASACPSVTYGQDSMLSSSC